jgi:hypothetical protein
VRAANVSERRAGLETAKVEVDPLQLWGRPMSPVKRARNAAGDSTRVVTAARVGNGRCAIREVSNRGSNSTMNPLDKRRRTQMAEERVVPQKPGNAGGGEGEGARPGVESGREPGDSR